MGSYGAQELTDQRDFRGSLVLLSVDIGEESYLSLWVNLLLLSENALRSVLCIL